MKKTLLLLAALAMAGSAYAQGTITFSTFNETSQVFRPGGTVGAGVGYTAGLFLSSDLNTALLTATFIPDAGFQGWINPPDNDAVVPGHLVNSTDSSFVVKAWETGKTFAASTIKGQSLAFSAGPLGGSNGASPPTTAPDIGNMHSFTMTPEPTTIALGALGLGALLIRRRK